MWLSDNSRLKIVSTCNFRYCGPICPAASPVIRIGPILYHHTTGQLIDEAICLLRNHCMF